MSVASTDFSRNLAVWVTQLQEGDYPLTLRALGFIQEARFNPQALRKDGTPDWHHPVEAARLLWQRRDLGAAAGLNVDDVLAVTLLHDTPENHLHVLQPGEIETKFGAAIAEAVYRLDKLH